MKSLDPRDQDENQASTLVAVSAQCLEITVIATAAVLSSHCKELQISCRVAQCCVHAVGEAQTPSV